MAWTSPLTAVANAALTAAQWNASVRDNLNETATAKATTAGRLIVSTGLNSVTERDIVTASVGTAQTSASTTYTDLTTVGPNITITTGAKALVMVSALISNATVNARSWMGFDVSGASTIGATDLRALAYISATANAEAQMSQVSLLSSATATLTPGSNVFTAKYRVTSGTGSWTTRYLTVMAL